MTNKTIIEPFRIKMVEPITLTTSSERKEFLEKAHYNPFLLKSHQVIIDLLTDSGTTAMSAQQWAAMMQGDESYAGAKSWERMKGAIEDLTGYPHILPTHQGRAAERILYGYLGGKGKVFVSNTHFDTTRANIEFSGAKLPTSFFASGRAIIGCSLEFEHPCPMCMGFWMIGGGLSAAEVAAMTEDTKKVLIALPKRSCVNTKTRV